MDLIVAECDVQTVLPVWRQLDSALPFLRQPTPTWACRVLPQIRISYGRTLLNADPWSMKCTSQHLTRLETKHILGKGFSALWSCSSRLAEKSFRLCISFASPSQSTWSFGSLQLQAAPSTLLISFEERDCC